MDRSKALDLCFSELHRSSFLGFVRKYRHINKNNSPFLNVFARKIHQRPVTSANRRGRHCGFGGKFRPGNVCFLWWGYDPPGKPEYPIFVTETDFRESEFPVFLVSRIPTTRSRRSPGGGLFLQIQSGDVTSVVCKEKERTAHAKEKKRVFNSPSTSSMPPLQ